MKTKGTKAKYNPQLCGECAKKLDNWIALTNHMAIHNDELKLKQKFDNSGEGNPNWKADKARYAAIHYYVSKIKPKPKLCERCNEVEPKQLANLTGVYTKEPNDYSWLCVRCHFILDDRKKYLKQFAGDYNKK